MQALIQEISDALARLAQSGNVRQDGEALLSSVRVAVSQLSEQAEKVNQDNQDAKPDPVQDQLSRLAEKVDLIAEDFQGVSDLVSQLASLAGDLQAATVKG